MKSKSFYVCVGLQAALILCFALLLVHFLPKESTKNYSILSGAFVPLFQDFERLEYNINESKLINELTIISDRYLETKTPDTKLEYKIVKQTNDLFCYTISIGENSPEWKIAINIGENSSYRVAVFT